MDFDSSSKFIGSLAKFLQSLCNGYVEFDKGVEVIGHIYLSVDSNTGKKIDYVLNEKVCKNDNSVTFISNSFHAQPAEKPKPTPKKSDIDKRNDDSTVVMDESGQAIPNSTNVGTMGASAMRIRGSQDDSFSPGSKRPRSPLHHRSGGGGRGPSSPASRPGVSRYDSGGPAKMARSDIPYSSGNPMNSNNEDYDYQEEDNYPTNFLNQDDQNSSQDVDQKPIIDPDISIVKEEHMASQQANTQNPLVYSHSSGPGRGKAPPVMPQSPYQMMPSPSLGSHVSDTYTGSSLEGADPSTPHSLVSVSQGCAFKLMTQNFKNRRQRFTESNVMYTSAERDEIGRYALAYGASAASQHYSNLLHKRIPRSSVQNFVYALRKDIDEETPS